MWDIIIHYSVFWLRHCMNIENSGKIVQYICFCIHEYDLHNVIEKLQASSLEWNGNNITTWKNTNMLFSSHIRWLTHLTIPLLFATALPDAIRWLPQPFSSVNGTFQTKKNMEVKRASNPEVSNVEIRTTSAELAHKKSSNHIKSNQLLQPTAEIELSPNHWRSSCCNKRIFEEFPFVWPRYSE